MNVGGYSVNYTDTLNLAEKYDPNSNTWTPIPGMMTPRGDVMCAAMNGLFVVAGGFYDPTGQFIPASFRSEVQAYNPATGASQSLTAGDTSSSSCASISWPLIFSQR